MEHLSFISFVLIVPTTQKPKGQIQVANCETSFSGSNVGLDALIKGEFMSLGKSGYAAADEPRAVDFRSF